MRLQRHAVKASLKASAYRLIWIWWMHSRQDVCWTVWLDTGSVRFCGRKSRRGLSAGRVQSVSSTDHLQTARKRSHAFIPEEYWTLDADFTITGEQKAADCQILRYGKRKDSDSFKRRAGYRSLKELEGAKYQVADVKKGERTKKAADSVYNQYASAGSFQGAEFFHTENHACCTAAYMKEWMSRDSGTVGMITYLRTDSTRISDEADASARAYVEEHYGEEYVSAAGAGRRKSGKKIQDAHEAIRPTDITRTPFVLKESLTRDQFRLYQLIWKRFAASRMANAQYTTTSVKIDAAGLPFPCIRLQE